MKKEIRRTSQLSLEEKRAMLVQLLQMKKKESFLPPPFGHQQRPSHPLPLSFAQERLWFLDRLMPGNSAYNLSLAVQINGQLHLQALEQSLHRLQQRHESLRTTFTDIEGRPIQVIAEPQPMTVLVIDMQEVAPQEQAAIIYTLVDQMAQLPYDLIHGPLWRVGLWRLSEQKHGLLLGMHHIISDGWSIGVLVRELLTLYHSRTTTQPAALAALPIQYADYALWQRGWLQGEVLQRQLTYWKDQLTGATTLELPTDHPRPTHQTFRGAHHPFTLSASLTEQLVHLSLNEGATLFMTLLAAFKLLLFHWTQQTDLVVGTVTANRTTSETDHLIGCFMNFLALRSQLSEQETGQHLLAHVKATLLDAYTHQECPFEKVVAAIKRDRRLDQNPLYSVAFLLQNHALKKAPSEAVPGELQISPLPLSVQAAPLDLRFVVQETETAIGAVCEYNPDLFEEETIVQLVASYREILEQLVHHPEQALSHFHISPALIAQAQHARQRERKQQITLAATFTVEPIEEPLSFWMHELAIPADIRFAPYHQVIQQLLDPASLLIRNHWGVNVVLVRLEDWLYRTENEPGKPATLSQTAQQLERSADDFLDAVYVAASRMLVPLLIYLCPASLLGEGDAHWTTMLERQEARIASALKAVNGVYLMSPAQILATYPVKTFYDPYADKVGHVPFTPPFFTALATSIARTLAALQRAAYKVIVLDCDNTLWQGVCGEDGAQGIKLDAASVALQEQMVAQQDAGMLLCLCSKNNEQDVLDVFEQRPEMPLGREHLISWRINWQEKSENLTSLAQELGIGLESFILIDDDARECAEVQARCPKVVTIHLPQEQEKRPAFLRHLWVLDHLRVTQEDRTRTRLYQQSQQRERLHREGLTLDAFLAELQVRVHISPLETGQIARVAQLTQRTNQFTMRTIRRTEQEIQTQWHQGVLEGLVVEVSDRFGAYGLVGVLLFAMEPGALRVDTFLLSCRVLGRGVEYQMLARLGQLAKERGVASIQGIYRPTPRNTPAFDFLQEVGVPFEAVGGEEWRWELSSEDAARTAFRGQGERKEHVGEEERGHDGAASMDSTPASGTTEGVSQLMRRIALELSEAETIWQQVSAQKQQERKTAQEFVAPQTSIEELLVEIWSQVLRIDRVGINDNFFELGGHSLLATQVVSRLSQFLQIELPLSVFFEAPTVAELAQILVRYDDALPKRAETVVRLLKRIKSLSANEVRSALQDRKKAQG